jgi:hypothetical protein
MNIAPNIAGTPRRHPHTLAKRIAAVGTVVFLVSGFALASALPARAEDAADAPAVTEIADSGEAQAAPPVEGDGADHAEAAPAPAEDIAVPTEQDAAAPAEQDAAAPAEQDAAAPADDESAAAPAGPAPSADAKAVAQVAPLTLESEANQEPVAVDDHFEMSQDTTLVVAAPGLLANDLGPEGTSLFADAYTAPTVGAFESNTPWGSFAYSPPAGFTGVVSFQYSATDDIAVSAPATVTIDVKPAGVPVVLPPVPEADEYLYALNTPLWIAAPGVLGNDAITGPVQSLAVVDMPPGSGQVQLDADGSFLYTPEPFTGGSWWFRYEVCTAAGCAIGEAALLQAAPGVPPSGPVSAGGAYPVAEDDHYQVIEGETLEVMAPGLLANDHDAEQDSFEVAEWTAPQGTVQIAADGAMLYTPPAGFLGTDSFDYRVAASDGTGASGWATVEIDVLPEPNIPPVAVDDYFETPYETDVEVHLCLNDTDAEGHLIGAGKIENVTGGTIVGANGQQCYFFFAPDAGFSGAATFTYYAFDRYDAAVRSIQPATVTIMVGAPAAEPANILPVAADDLVSTPRNILLVLHDAALTANDTDADGDALDVWILGGIGDSFTGETWGSDANGIHYMPPKDFVGTRQLLLAVSDGTGTTTSVLTVMVVEPIDPADPVDPADPADPVETTDPADPGDPTDPSVDVPASSRPEPGLGVQHDAAPAAAEATAPATALAATGSESGALLLAAAVLTLAGSIIATAARVRRRSPR